MNTKLRFKVIGLLVVISLATLLVSQGFWLRGLYNTTWQQTDDRIREAMQMADYKELFSRMDEIRLKQIKEQGDSITFSRRYSYNFSDSVPIVTRIPKDEEFSQLTVDITAEDEEIITNLPDYLKHIRKSEQYLLFSMHYSLDQEIPISYTNYYAFLEEELAQLYITKDYFLQVGYRNAWYNYPQDPGAVDISAYIEYVYEVPQMEDQEYRLYIRSPYRLVLSQMKGILITSSLLILLVVAAFTYLLRTILQQKTVEELKTDFTNNMTHELKTPIAVAFAANDALLNYDENVTEKQQKYLGIIREQLEALTGLVEQILTLSVENRSTLHLHKEAVHLYPLLVSLTEQQKIKFCKEVEFVLDVPEELTIVADRIHLYNMINNLVDNAVKYSTGDPVKVFIEATVDNKETRITVSDNGIGIREEDQKRIFDKFYRVPQGNLHTVKGFGLGLFYLKDMMCKHDGFVSLKSKPGKGTAFTLHFKNEA